MIISFKALAKILAILDEQYVIELLPQFLEENRFVARFVVSNAYPCGPHITMSDNRDDAQVLNDDRKSKKDGQVLLHYDIDRDRLVSCNSNVYQKLKDRKWESKRNQIRHETDQLCS